MAESSSSSAQAGVSISLITGATSPGPHLVAEFRIGGKDEHANDSYQYHLCSGGTATIFPMVGGHLTWDPTYNGSGSGFFSVAPVRLEVTPQTVKWAVGTSAFIETIPKPFWKIDKLQVCASAVRAAGDRSVQWDALEMILLHADGYGEKCVSQCLPRVSTRHGTRRSAFAPNAAATALLQQFAEISPNRGDVISVQLRGTVTLRADEREKAALLPDDLCGRVLVFVDSGTDR